MTKKSSSTFDTCFTTNRLSRERAKNARLFPPRAPTSQNAHSANAAAKIVSTSFVSTACVSASCISAACVPAPVSNLSSRRLRHHAARAARNCGAKYAVTPCSAMTTWSESPPRVKTPRKTSATSETGRVSPNVSDPDERAIAAAYASERSADAARAHRASYRAFPRSALAEPSRPSRRELGDATSASGDVSSKAKHTVPRRDAK